MEALYSQALPILSRGLLRSYQSHLSPWEHCFFLPIHTTAAEVEVVALLKGLLAGLKILAAGHSCTAEVQRAIPVLKKAYGDSMHKVLHVGPDTCAVVSTLLSEEETEAWGVEPYDVEDAGRSCKALVRKDVVRVVDIKYPLPYRPKSFSIVLVSDALDYLSDKYLNKTLPDLARVSVDGLVVFTGYPRKQRAKAAEVSKFGKAAKLRSTSWWSKYFGQISLEENEDAAKKFKLAATKMSYVSNCQVFHLKSFN
ncbi:probable pectin methylesterase CGR3 isoform X3 [Prunus dulcis]|uniref:probable pectin methylesterase CGR3 isoform X3 n=1 Tax=Prunus dulcis TaxID=3755 RepID=UPI001483A719|nr:probable pectin methylesterase CGR3 isoform X3 [Prunus dulcis]